MTKTYLKYEENLDYMRKIRIIHNLLMGTNSLYVDRTSSVNMQKNREINVPDSSHLLSGAVRFVSPIEWGGQIHLAYTIFLQKSKKTYQDLLLANIILKKYKWEYVNTELKSKKMKEVLDKVVKENKI